MSKSNPTKSSKADSHVGSQKQVLTLTDALLLLCDMKLCHVSFIPTLPHVQHHYHNNCPATDLGHNCFFLTDCSSQKHQSQLWVVTILSAWVQTGPNTTWRYLTNISASLSHNFSINANTVFSCFFFITQFAMTLVLPGGRDKVEHVCFSLLFAETHKYKEAHYASSF